MNDKPLHIKHRPKIFGEVIGNELLVETIQQLIQQPQRPHTYLLQGPRGTGKTTLARIMAMELGAYGPSLIEMDIAYAGGKEQAKKIADNAGYKTLGGGKSKVYILDECFHKSTIISCLEGSKKISDIKIGDIVHNKKGVGEVKNIFKNFIPIDRLICITLSNSKKIFCSLDHKFFIDNKWIKAKDLTSNMICTTLIDIEGQINIKSKGGNYDPKTMQFLQRRIHSKKKVKYVLLRKLLNKRSMEKNKRRNSYSNREKGTSNYKKELFALLKRVYYKAKERQNQRKIILFPYLCWEMEGGERKWFYEKSNKKWRSCKTRNKKVLEYRTRNEPKETIFKKNERKQPIKRSINKEENDCYKNNKRNSSYLEREEGWEWTTYYTSKVISWCFTMGHGISNLFGKTKERVSNLLQSGYSKSRFKISDRSKWSVPCKPKSKNTGSKEKKEAERIRVESIKFYQPRNSNRYFKGVVGSEERSSGFIEFFDLEISNHHSYFANGVLVHNCQRGSKHFFDALLKITEDPPNTVYFILCTTEPQVFPKTIISRCSLKDQFTSLLERKQIMELLKTIIKKEKASVPIEVLSEVARLSQGSPREAVVTLGDIINLDSKEKMLQALSKTIEYKTNIKVLCRAFLNRKSWKIVAPIASNLEGDIEQVRHAILTYMKKVLISQGKVEIASEVISLFEQPFYNSGEAGFINACYLSTLE